MEYRKSPMNKWDSTNAKDPTLKAVFKYVDTLKTDFLSHMVMMENWQRERQACNHFDTYTMSRTICAGILGILDN